MNLPNHETQPQPVVLHLDEVCDAVSVHQVQPGPLHHQHQVQGVLEGGRNIIINTRAAKDFTRVHPRLGDQDRVLDFGCGTGETTLAIAKGQLGDLGTPDQVR